MTAMTSPAANPALQTQIGEAAAAAGLTILGTEAVTAFDGTPVTRFTLALPADSRRTLALQLSDSFQAGTAEFAPVVASYLGEMVNRLRNPVPGAMLTLGGIPLVYEGFEWPFHESTAGADTSLVHGRVNLADGSETPLHAKVSASMTVTFREIVRAPEQPFAESFILNAVRKILDQGQLELVKSGNRQPVPVTTRFYSARSGRFVFNDTTEAQRREFLAGKVFWLSGVLGSGVPVWLLDPRDAQYLNTTIADLKISVEALAKDGTIALTSDPAFASPSRALMDREANFREKLAAALAFIKPSFNEEMRHGQSNL